MKHLDSTSSIEQLIDPRLRSEVIRAFRIAWNAWPNVHGRWYFEGIARKPMTKLRAEDDRELADVAVSRNDLYGMSIGLCCAPRGSR